MGSFYNFLIGSFEILASISIGFLCYFTFRRNIMRIQRFLETRNERMANTDANLILIFEVLLMTAFLFMMLQTFITRKGVYDYAGAFPISSILTPMLSVFQMELYYLLNVYVGGFILLEYLDS